MQAAANNLSGTTLQPAPRPADGVESGRKELTKGQPDLDKMAKAETSKVQPEEILDQIKALTEDGLYSVRFENSQEFNELVVKVVDTNTHELIRQYPAEEVLGVKASLEELRGQIVNTAR